MQFDASSLFMIEVIIKIVSNTNKIVTNRSQLNDQKIKRVHQNMIQLERYFETGRMTKVSKKQVWYEVQENETIEQCLERMKKDGYMPVGRKEEPIFEEVNGEPSYLRQKIQFKGMYLSEQGYFQLKTEQ